MKTIAGKTKRKPKAATARKPKAKRKPAAPPRPSVDRVAVGTLKQHLSRYVREVQQSGRAITITQHGRDTAVLAPTSTPAAAPLNMRPPLDLRPLGELITKILNTPFPDGSPPPSAEAVQQALDETRADRF